MNDEREDTRDDGDRLREEVRRAIGTGAIPAVFPLRTWGGRGSGAKCAVCRAAVAREDIELEVELAWDDGVRTLHLHQRCFAAWEMELRSSDAEVSQRG